MSLKIDAFNNQPEQMGTLRRFFSLKRSSQKNGYTPNSSHSHQSVQKASAIGQSVTGSFQKREESFYTACRSIYKIEEKDDVKNLLQTRWTKSLGRRKKEAKILTVVPKSTLEQAKVFFGDEEDNENPSDLSNKTMEESSHHSGNRKSFLGTLKRTKTFLRNLRNSTEKSPEEMDDCLTKAKNFFMSEKYREAKKFFNQLLGSSRLDELGKKPEVYLYLTAIHLLENDGTKAFEYLDEIENGYLKLLMHKHSSHLSNTEMKEKPFPEANFYGIENESEDEKIIMDKLFKASSVSKKNSQGKK
ncbi:MAG: hypothetical protein ACRCU0_03985 [Candidatus Rhabdochlamydia sp.]